MNFIENESKQKLRGGYYTPMDIALFISRWASEKKPQHILEPSCGDGIFFEALSLVNSPSKVSLTGFELHEEEALKARRRCKSLGLDSTTNIHTKDFLGWAINQIVSNEQLFDSVVGNPPFIRYQYLAKTAQEKAEIIFKLLNLPFTKHTNAWVPFVLASMALLKPGGRLAMVAPAEIIHVTHAQSLRSYLGRKAKSLLIIDPIEIWFEDTLQGSVILLAEKKKISEDSCDGVSILSVKGREFLNENPSSLFKNTERTNGKTIEGKWTRAFLTASERALLDYLAGLPEVHKFDQIADVDVGIVTGANKYFLVTDDVVNRYNLHKWARPMFGRSEHCPGVIYDKNQHRANSIAGRPTNLIYLNGNSSSFNTKVFEYIKSGESQGLHKRYKCRVRKPWYSVPSVYSTQIGMLKRAHDAPKLIYNKMEAYTTDTAYRIKTKSCGAQKLVFCFINPLTALSAELEGRYYGGGVLELIPSEIERLLIPLPQTVRPSLRKLDTLVKSNCIADALEQQNGKILGSLGLNKSKQNMVLEAWLRLKNRRQRITMHE